MVQLFARTQLRGRRLWYYLCRVYRDAPLVAKFDINEKLEDEFAFEKSITLLTRKEVA